MQLTECILSLDIGTTHVKAFAYAKSGNVLGKASRSLSGPGAGVQDTEGVWEEVLAVLKAIASVCAALELTPACLSISGAMHSMLPVDGQGIPLSPARLWSDNSGATYAASVRDTPEGKLVYQETGTPIHPMSPLIKICWLRENQPELFASAARFISIKEYIWHKLTGSWKVDYSIASATGLFASGALRWSDTAIRLAQITPERLSTPVSPYYHEELLVGPLHDAGFQRTFPVVIGGNDGCLALLGSAPLRPGNISLSMGTSAAVRSVVPRFEPDPTGRTFTYLLDEHHFVAGGPSNNCGGVFSWITGLFTGTGWPDLSQLEAQNSLAAGISPGAEGLVFIPYIFGERAPLWDPGASGSFSGIRNTHTRAHFARAAMEGVLFNLRFILELMSARTDVREIFTGGGMAAFPLWVQTLADILNHNLMHTAGKEDSSAGAALIGMKALGLISSLEDQSVFYHQPVAVLPQPEAARIYEPLYQQFKGTVLNLTP